MPSSFMGQALKNPEFYFGAYYLVLVNFMITHPNN